jgi:hypothetical protein
MWTAVANAIMKLRILQNVGNLSSGYTSGGLLSNTELHRVSLSS